MTGVILFYGEVGGEVDVVFVFLIEYVYFGELFFVAFFEECLFIGATKIMALCF